jgi:hypothetical protein
MSARPSWRRRLGRARETRVTHSPRTVTFVYEGGEERVYDEFQFADLVADAARFAAAGEGPVLEAWIEDVKQAAEAAAPGVWAAAVAFAAEYGEPDAWVPFERREGRR